MTHRAKTDARNRGVALLAELAIVLVVMTGCSHTRVERRYRPIAQCVTPELINRHLRLSTQPSTNYTKRIAGNNLALDFWSGCEVTIGAGGSFFTEKDYQDFRDGLFAKLLGDGLFPKIGRRAYIAGIEQEIVLFTTTDGRFDVRVEPRGTPEPINVVGVASELSESYDRVARSRVEKP